MVVAFTTSGSGTSRPAVANRGVSGVALEVPTQRRMPGGCPVTRPNWMPRRGLREGRLWVAFGPAGGTYRVPPANVAPDGSLGV